jgi:glycosyltransferase involved in cell wall biosynthesis
MTFVSELNLKISIFSSFEDSMEKDSGASVRMYNLAKGLVSSGNVVEVIIPKKASSIEHVDGIIINGVRGFLPKAILDVVRRLVGVERSTSLYFYDFLFASRSIRLFREADVVQIEQQTAGALFIPFIRIVLRKLVVLDCHDVFQASRVQHTGFLRRFLETFLENLAYKYANLILTVSENERNLLLSHGVNNDLIEVVPNGVDSHLFSDYMDIREARDKYKLGDAQIVIFVGNMKYLPNSEAVELLSSSIAPKVLEQVQNVRFVVVGKTSGIVRPSNLTFTGVVDSVPEVLAVSDVAVAPLLHGSGTRLKILEYFSCSLPVVSTSVGAEGLEVKNGTDIIIEDDFDRFSSAVINLLKDKSLRHRIGQAARMVATKKYDWQIVSRKLENILYRRLNAREV